MLHIPEQGFQPVTDRHTAFWTNSNPDKTHRASLSEEGSEKHRAEDEKKDGVMASHKEMVCLGAETRASHVEDSSGVCLVGWCGQTLFLLVL